MTNTNKTKTRAARLLAIAVHHYQRGRVERFAKWHRLHVQAAKDERASYPCTHAGTLCANCLKFGNSTLGYSPDVVL